MRLIPDNLSQAYTVLRGKISDAPHPLRWCDRIRICMPQAKLSKPAKHTDITSAEKKLGVRFPDDLRDLLLETNGIDGLYSSPVCSIDQIVSMNQKIRSAEYLADRMPFDHLLFFGDTGNGDDFAFPVFRNGGVGTAVFMWEHETDCRQEYAASLSHFLIYYAVEYYAISANRPAA
ncbi:MAG TPA: SMI1/KNR4 family protein [Candidatus Sulfotelmatobacter sp.]|jgi:hypothetical protein|nr:SMI1/KNR4 family protein [Candidatus Sulfotelmatobacter sp.]